MTKRNGKLLGIAGGQPGPHVSVLDCIIISRACLAWEARRGLPPSGFHSISRAEIAAKNSRRAKKSALP